MTPSPDENQTNQQTETPEQKYQRLYQQEPNTSGSLQTTPAQQQYPAELLSALQTMQDKIDRLSIPPAVTSPAEPEPTGTEWVDLIRQGKFKEAEDSIVKATQRSLKPQLDQVRQQAYQDALTASQVNNAMAEYLRDKRATNQDFAKFEDYLEAPVTRRVELAKQAGRIKTGDDLIREYKSAVDAEETKLRTLGLQFRADGKQEALTRNREVLASSTLQPQQLSITQSPSQDSQTPPETNDDYFARRKADEMRRRGLI